MPISIQYKNITENNCIIRPTPLVNINSNAIRNKYGNLGKSYSITLQGYIIADQGFPLARGTNHELFPYVKDGPVPTGNAGPYESFDTTQSHYYEGEAGMPTADFRPSGQYVPFTERVQAIFHKQKALKALFATDGQRMEISPISNDEPAVICYPRLVDISFTDGIYVDICQYTVQLECDLLYDKDHQSDVDGHPIHGSGDGTIIAGTGLSYEDLIAISGRFIEEFSDSWSLEVDDALGESAELPRSYRISRTLSATGKDTYGPNDLLNGQKTSSKLQAWEQARDFVHYKMADDEYPNVMGSIGSGTVTLIDAYRGYNKTRTESISIDNGTYSITENWLLSSGTAYENYDMSISTSTDNAFVNVSINGSIRGLSSLPPSSVLYGGSGALPLGASGYTPYQNALRKYYEVSNSGKFGVGSNVYKRANNVVAVNLNAQSTSTAIAMNEYDGSITYNLSFNNRPTNIISGVLTETIDVTDTYPGDVFAVIPVLGRRTGPVLQNIGGRTEYRRSASIGLLLDYTDIPYGSGRRSLLLQKPTLVEPTRTQLKNLIKEISPEYEPGIRKWFVEPPQEQWNPKTGNWSVSLNWIYEIDE